MKFIWYKDGMNNWGDYLAPVLTKYLMGSEGDFVKYDDQSNDDRYITIGSLMEHISNPNTIVWGTGFMWENGKVPVIPKKIHAVRGPLSRNNLIKQGISCPEVYGDPALLFPRYYNPNVEKKYKLGIIPHYVDANNKWITNINDPDIKIINICSDTYKFVDELKQCESILSSTLHGMIASDAYNIPCMWIKLSDNVGGNGFKFRDYFASVNRSDINPYIINEYKTKVDDVYKLIPNYKIDIDLDLLYNSCPFKIK